MRAKTVAWQSVLGIPSEVDGSPDIHLLVRRSRHRAIVRQIERFLKFHWVRERALSVAKELIESGMPVTGFAADVEGDLPIGAGLSSSAAFEVSTALFLLKLFPQQLAPLQIAKACQRAEHCFIGVQSGLLDRVTSLFGRANHAIFFDCRTEEVRTIPFPPGLGLVIADSGKNRELASGKCNSRREETQTSARVLGCVRFAMLPCHSWRPIPVCRNKYVVECGTSLKKKIASGARWSFWKTAMAPDSGN
jgi:galactokinase